MERVFTHIKGRSKVMQTLLTPMRVSLLAKQVVQCLDMIGIWVPWDVSLCFESLLVVLLHHPIVELVSWESPLCRWLKSCTSWDKRSTGGIFGEIIILKWCSCPHFFLPAIHNLFTKKCCFNPFKRAWDWGKMVQSLQWFWCAFWVGGPKLDTSKASKDDRHSWQGTNHVSRI